MPKFAYVATRPDGSTVKGVEEALSSSLAQTALISRDMDPISVVEKKSVMQFEITKKKVPRKELMHFSRQLAVFVRAGIPILDAMDVIAEGTVNKLFKKSLEEIIEALKAGDTFAGAAAAHPEAFPPFYLGILRSAELTGNLDAVLDQLSDYIERDLEAKRKITSALVYPGVVMVMSVFTVVILTAFVLPRFEKFFSGLHAQLPLPTRILLNTSHFLTTWWFLFAGLFALVVIGTMVALRTERGRNARDRLLLRMPVVGDLWIHALLERFCRILSSMVGAGVPLPEAMRVTADATNNAVYKRGLMTAREAMVRGEGLARPLAATHLFPPAANQMFRVGEDTGTLDEQLHTAAVYFDRELDYKIKRFTNLFEPAVIVVMGVVVGFVAIALVSAMYGIFRQVNVPG
jgi:type IV pilus assembly protein PilC